MHNLEKEGCTISSISDEAAVVSRLSGATMGAEGVWSRLGK